jgi:hypothetical protein
MSDSDSGRIVTRAGIRGRSLDEITDLTYFLYLTHRSLGHRQSMVQEVRDPHPS